MRPYYKEFMKYIKTHCNPVMYTSLEKVYLEKITKSYPLLEDLVEENGTLCGYLYQDSNILIHNEDQVFKELVKVIFMNNFDNNKSILIDHNSASLLFSGNQAFFATDYDASDDFLRKDYYLKMFIELMEKYRVCQDVPIKEFMKTENNFNIDELIDQVQNEFSLESSEEKDFEDLKKK